MENFIITHIGNTKLYQPMPFIYVPAKGKSFKFQDKEDSNETTKREGVNITFETDFYLCAYPATQEFWEAVVNASNTKELDPQPSEFKGSTRPVEQVSWDDIQLFNNALNSIFTYGSNIKIDGEREKGGFGLPSETQWEYAANAEQGLVFSGSQNLNDVGWYAANSNEQTMPVGLKQPNAWGFYDMSGNVWEWCADDHSDNLSEIPINGSPNLKKTKFKILRGGGYFRNARYCRLRFRYNLQPDARSHNYGFRLRFSPGSSEG